MKASWTICVFEWLQPSSLACLDDHTHVENVFGWLHPSPKAFRNLVRCVSGIPKRISGGTPEETMRGVPERILRETLIQSQENSLKEYRVESIKNRWWHLWKILWRKPRRILMYPGGIHERNTEQIPNKMSERCPGGINEEIPGGIPGNSLIEIP